MLKLRERFKKFLDKKKARPLKEGFQEKKDAIEKKRILAAKIQNGFFHEGPNHA